MTSNVQAFRVPQYAQASKRRSLSEFSALDYFVSEHEPSALGNEPYVIERWREDLSWCMLQAENEADQRVADLRTKMDQELEDTKNSMGTIILVMLSAFVVSVVVNIVLIFSR